MQMRTSARGIPFERLQLAAPWNACGLPVVFHHGIGATHQLWTRWVLALAERHPLVRFDMRGFGQAPVLPPAGSSDLLGELIDDLLDVAGDEKRVHLVGESAGGTIALAAALRHPERVASVTVCNAAFVGRGIGQIDGWRDLFEQAGVKGWSDRMMECRFAPGAIGEDAWRWFAAQQERTRPAAAMAVAAMLAAVDLTRELPTLKPPLLILAPDSSPFISVEMAQMLHELVPGSELHVFRGVRHGLPFSHADECARLLLDFLGRKAE